METGTWFITGTNKVIFCQIIANGRSQELNKSWWFSGPCKDRQIANLKSQIAALEAQLADLETRLKAWRADYEMRNRTHTQDEWWECHRKLKFLGEL